MGLETRNESTERPEQIERAKEQDTIKSERIEINDSDFDDVDKKSNKPDSSEQSVEKKDIIASEKEEDFSDVKENGQKDKVQEYPDVSQEKHRIAAEDFAEPPNKEDIIIVDEPVGDDKSEKEVNQEEPDSQIVEDNTEPSLEIKETDRDNETSLDESKELDENDAKDNEVHQENNNLEKLPKWYESLTEGQIETHKGLQEIAKEYVDKQPLSDGDKEELSDRQFEYLKSRQPEDRDDSRLPTPESIKSIEMKDGCAIIIQNWKEGTDGAELGSRKMEVIKRGITLDRIGTPDGRYLSPLNEYGRAYTEKERATGERMVEQPIEKNSSYHKYVVKQDLTRENFKQAIEQHYSGDEHDKMLEKLDEYYKDCCNPKSRLHRGDVYSDKPEQEIDGIKAGKVDHMFRSDDGGGRQYIMPFSVSQMHHMGFLSKI